MAENETEAEQLAIKQCADDSEALLPCNMEIVTKQSKLPNSYFDLNKCINCNKDMPDDLTGYCYECNEHLTNN